MKIYECDICREQKACSQVRIEDKNYDLCEKCKASLTKKLEGRGESIPTGWTYPINYPITYTYTSNSPKTIDVTDLWTPSYHKLT